VTRAARVAYRGPTTPAALYRSMETAWLVDMRAAFTLDRAAAVARRDPSAVRFIDGRLTLIARALAAREDAPR